MEDPSVSPFPLAVDLGLSDVERLDDPHVLPVVLPLTEPSAALFDAPSDGVALAESDAAAVVVIAGVALARPDSVPLALPLSLLAADAVYVDVTLDVAHAEDDALALPVSETLALARAVDVAATESDIVVDAVVVVLAQPLPLPLPLVLGDRRAEPLLETDELPPLRPPPPPLTEGDPESDTLAAIDSLACALREENALSLELAVPLPAAEPLPENVVRPLAEFDAVSRFDGLPVGDVVDDAVTPLPRLDDAHEVTDTLTLKSADADTRAALPEAAAVAQDVIEEVVDAVDCTVSVIVSRTERETVAVSDAERLSSGVTDTVVHAVAEPAPPASPAPAAPAEMLADVDFDGPMLELDTMLGDAKGLTVAVTQTELDALMLALKRADTLSTLAVALCDRLKHAELVAVVTPLALYVVDEQPDPLPLKDPTRELLPLTDEQLDALMLLDGVDEPLPLGAVDEEPQAVGVPHAVPDCVPRPRVVDASALWVELAVRDTDAVCVGVSEDVCDPPPALTGVLVGALPLAGGDSVAVVHALDVAARRDADTVADPPTPPTRAVVALAPRLAEPETVCVCDGLDAALALIAPDAVRETLADELADVHDVARPEPVATDGDADCVCAVDALCVAPPMTARLGVAGGVALAHAESDDETVPVPPAAEKVTRAELLGDTVDETQVVADAVPNAAPPPPTALAVTLAVTAVDVDASRLGLTLPEAVLMLADGDKLVGALAVHTTVSLEMAVALPVEGALADVHAEALAVDVDDVHAVVDMDPVARALELALPVPAPTLEVATALPLAVKTAVADVFALGVVVAPPDADGLVRAEPLDAALADEDADEIADTLGTTV